MSGNNHPPMVVMGVSGSGKSTVGALVGQRLGVAFVDGDDLHPPANKEKMRAGLPLDDEDRRPWLRAVGRTLQSRQRQGGGSIVACSALKRRYRDLLREHAPDVLFIHLDGSMEMLAGLMESRSHGFMPATLLTSQLAALEPLGADECHLLLDIRQAPEELAERVIDRLGGAVANAVPAGE